MSHKVSAEKFLPTIGTKQGGSHQFEGFVPVLGPSGTLHPSLFPAIVRPYVVTVYQVADEAERRSLFNSARIGDMAKQADNLHTYILKEGTGSLASDWLIIGTESANTSAVGEPNTASNLGITGIGIFKQKSAVDLQFKKLKPASVKISILDNPSDNTIDFDLNVTTSDVIEGTRMYFTDARADSRVNFMKGVSLGIAGLNSDRQVPLVNLPDTVTSKSITVESPTNAEDISFFFINQQITVTKIVAQLIGTGSVTWNLRHGTDRNSVGTKINNDLVTTGNSNVTLFNSSNVPVNSFIWLTTVDKTGTVSSLHITIVYK